MVQRKFGGFLHSLCETSLRLFQVPVPRPKQALQPVIVIGLLLLTPWTQQDTISPKAQTSTDYAPVFTGIIPKVPGIF